ncbi:unnamed protein product [Peronospora belbahrii]|uniref:Uncharacterized protein n=1 Tax=Peronospora belbahrii TaxID=622444 RepID=A0ABN8CSW3_9STRA|nr:unnamed protein product [Peronospora belbahrii]
MGHSGMEVSQVDLTDVGQHDFDYIFCGCLPWIRPISPLRSPSDQRSGMWYGPNLDLDPGIIISRQKNDSISARPAPPRLFS